MIKYNEWKARSSVVHFKNIRRLWPSLDLMTSVQLKFKLMYISVVAWSLHLNLSFSCFSNFLICFHSVQPTFFSICATLFVLNLTRLPPSVAPPSPLQLLPYIPSTSQTLWSISLSSISLSTLSGRPPTLPPKCKRVREWKRQREGESKIYKYKKAERSELSTTLYN